MTPTDRLDEAILNEFLTHVGVALGSSRASDVKLHHLVQGVTSVAAVLLIDLNHTSPSLFICCFDDSEATSGIYMCPLSCAEIHHQVRGHKYCCTHILEYSA